MHELGVLLDDVFECEVDEVRVQEHSGFSNSVPLNLKS